MQVREGEASEGHNLIKKILYAHRWNKKNKCNSTGPVQYTLMVKTSVIDGHNIVIDICCKNWVAFMMSDSVEQKLKD